MTQARPNDAGISLIEILVAVSILAIVASAVVLSVQPAADPLDREVDRLAARLQQASAESIALGQPVGLVIERLGSGYGFYRYVDGRWWALDDHPTLRSHTLDAPVRLDATGAHYAPGDEDVSAQAVPVVWFDPAGLTEPFELEMSGASGEVQIAWNEAGRVELSGVR